MGSNITYSSFAVKDKDGNYFIGYNKWDKQLRKAKLYNSYKWAKEITDDRRFADRESYIITVYMKECGRASYEK